MAMTEHGDLLNAIHPFIIDGVRHDSGCDLLRARAFPDEKLKCTCTAVLRTTRRAVAAAERERIACLLERVDNSMLDQAKLAAYVRGQETP
jgi:hypothetical protein